MEPLGGGRSALGDSKETKKKKKNTDDGRICVLFHSVFFTLANYAYGRVVIGHDERFIVYLFTDVRCAAYDATTRASAPSR